MIGKSYYVICDTCTSSEQLSSKSLKASKMEVEEMGWIELVGEKWICIDCQVKTLSEEVTNGNAAISKP